MSEDMIFNLEKDEPFNLEKLEPGIKNFYVGLSWTPSTRGDDVDLDAVLVATDSDGFVLQDKQKDCFLFFNNTGRDGQKPTAFEITEDNLDGEEVDNGIPDDEAIFINTDLVDERMKELRLFVVYHKAQGKTLSEVKDITLTIAPLLANKLPDLSSGKVASFKVAESGTGESMFVAKLVPNAVKGWDIVPVSEQGGNLKQIVIAHKIKG